VNASCVLAALALALLPAAALPQGFAGLGADAEGFALPQPEPDFAFPEDHGPHPRFRIEWWYVTANLRGADGTRYGAQWTLFRSALRPETQVGWASPQVWFAHAAVTTAEAHHVAETYARGGIGQAGVTTGPFRAWINDWAMTGRAAPEADDLDALRLTADGTDFAYDLALTAHGPLVFHGRDGYSVKSPRGQASYYYSQPYYRVTGTLELPDGPVEVTGRAWLDREWSSSPLAESQTGWDWFALHLRSGAKLMVYRLRDRAGPDFAPATWIGPDGSVRYVPDGAVKLTALETTRVARRQVPTSWRLQWPEKGLDITTRPLNPRSWMDTNVAYWEGPVTIEGSHEGEGYLEMTGYE